MAKKILRLDQLQLRSLLEGLAPRATKSLRESPFRRDPDESYSGDVADLADSGESEMRQYWAMEKERLCSESGGTPEDIADLMSAELDLPFETVLQFVNDQMRAEGSPC